jgi:hypothetical protein
MVMSVSVARIAYRVGQGWRAVAGRVDEDERAAALAWLPERARAAFVSLPVAYQRHHLDVYRRLWQAGCRDGDVLAAALLHDVGKVDGRRRVWLWQRVAAVLLGRWPALLAQLGEPSAGGWCYGFYLHVHHPAIGAARAAALGCSPRTVALIAAHQETASADPALALLRAADDET